MRGAQPMIAGLWSVAELEDLLPQKDQELAALENAFRAFDRAWHAWYPPSDEAWMRDYNALKARYAAARAKAAQAIALAESPVSGTLLHLNALPLFASALTAGSGSPSDAAIPADTEYRGVLTALQKTSGLVSPGDFQDLWNRLQAAQQAHAQATGAPAPAPIYDPPAIQPRTGTDLDLVAYKRARAVTAPFDGSSGPTKKTPTWKLLLLGAGLGLGGVAVAKVGGKLAWKTLWPF